MLEAQCVVCRQVREIHCTAEQFQAWQNGALLQNAMPDTPPAEREMLLSGICGECWKDTFRNEGGRLKCTTTKPRRSY